MGVWEHPQKLMKGFLLLVKSLLDKSLLNLLPFKKPNAVLLSMSNVSITTDGPTTTAVVPVDNESASGTVTHQTSTELPPGGNPDTELSESTTESDSDLSEIPSCIRGGR